MEGLPKEIVKLVLFWCEAKDLLKLSTVAKALRELATSDAYWKLLYIRKYKTKREKVHCFLGHGYFRAYYQEEFAKRIRSKTGRYCFSVAAANVDYSPVKALYPTGDSKITAIFGDGRVVAYDLFSGEAIHTLDTEQKASLLLEEYDTQRLRSRLSDAHQNKLFAFKTREYEGADFDIWSDIVTSQISGTELPQNRWRSNISVSPISFGTVTMHDKRTSYLSASPLTNKDINGFPIRSSSKSRTESISSESEFESGSISSLGSSLDSMSTGLTGCLSVDSKKKYQNKRHSSTGKRKKKKNMMASSEKLKNSESPFTEQKLNGTVSGVVCHNEITNTFSVLQKDGDNYVSSVQNMLVPPSWVVCTKEVLCAAVNVAYGLAARSAAFATGHSNGAILLWNRQSQYKGLIQTGPSKLTCLYLSRSFLISGDVNGVLQVWKLESESPRICHKLSNNSHSAILQCFLLDFYLIASSEDGTLAIWDINSGKLIAKEIAHKNGHFCCMDVARVHFATRVKNAPLLVVTGGADKLVKAYKFSFHSGQSTEARVLGGHTNAVRQVYVDHQKIVSCSDDGTIKVWDVESLTGKLLRTFKCAGREGKVPMVCFAVMPGVIIGGRTNGAIVGFTFTNRSSIIEEERLKSVPTGKKTNRSKYKQQKFLNVRTPLDYASRDAYMDILYDDAYF